MTCSPPLRLIIHYRLFFTFCVESGDRTALRTEHAETNTRAVSTTNSLMNIAIATTDSHVNELWLFQFFFFFFLNCVGYQQYTLQFISNYVVANDKSGQTAVFGKVAKSGKTFPFLERFNPMMHRLNVIYLVFEFSLIIIWKEVILFTFSLQI